MRAETDLLVDAAKLDDLPVAHTYRQAAAAVGSLRGRTGGVDLIHDLRPVREQVRAMTDAMITATRRWPTPKRCLAASTPASSTR